MVKESERRSAFKLREQLKPIIMPIGNRPMINGDQLR